MDAGLAAILGTVVGAGIGFAGTWWSDRRAAQHQREERRAGAYIEALTLLNRDGQTIRRTMPVFGPPPDLPAPITDEAAALVEARFSAHASLVMRQLLDSWVTLRLRFFALVGELADARVDSEGTREAGRAQGISYREAAGGRTPRVLWSEVEQVRRELLGGREDRGLLGSIEAQVRKELGHDD
jgi:hypothetical protein